jgi:hypothetical protein
MPDTYIMSEVVDGAPFFPCGPCGLKCHDFYGDTPTYALSGVLQCTDCYTITFETSTGFFVADCKFSFTGINGTGTATWGGSNWQVGIGDVVLSIYGTNDGTCGGSPTDVDAGAATLVITCTGDNLLTATLSVLIGAGAIPGVDKSVFLVVFEQDTPTASPVPNQLAAGDCGTESLATDSTTIFIGSDGTLTLAP